MNRRKLVVAIAGGAAALSLIGVGAGATFTDAVAATQSVNAGTMNMGIDQAGGAKSWTLPATAPEGSTFTTGPQQVTTRNNGNIGVTSILLTASDVNNGAANSLALKSELNVEITGWTGANGTGTPVVIYNGPLSTIEANGQAVTGPVAPGDTDPFTFTFYAGTNGANPIGASDVGYGNNLDNSTTLDNAAQGGQVTPTITVQYTG